MVIIIYKVIMSYANWIMSSIVKINTSMPILRLISEERDKKTGEVRLKIQITGKNIFPVIPLDYLKNNKIMSNFSKNDQDIICRYFDCKGKISKRITARTYDRKNKKFTYTIEFFDFESKTKKYITTNSLVYLSTEINTFDSDDANLINAELHHVQQTLKY